MPNLERYTPLNTMKYRKYRNFERAQTNSGEKVDSIVSHLAKAWGVENISIVTTIVDYWPDLIGELYGKRCRFDSFHNGVLTIVAFEPIWVIELQTRGTQIIHRCNSLLGQKVVKAFKVRLER